MGANTRDPIALKVKIEGRVQGVFFRGSTFDAAISHQVSGYVKNCADGSVEAVFQGPPKKVNAVLDWCWEGSPASRVDQVTARSVAFDPGIVDFQLRY